MAQPVGAAGQHRPEIQPDADAAFTGGFHLQHAAFARVLGGDEGARRQAQRGLPQTPGGAILEKGPEFRRTGQDRFTVQAQAQPSVVGQQVFGQGTAAALLVEQQVPGAVGEQAHALFSGHAAPEPSAGIAAQLRRPDGDFPPADQHRSVAGLLLQQQLVAADRRIGEKAAADAVIAQSVGRGQQAHARVVHHCAVHDLAR